MPQFYWLTQEQLNALKDSHACEDAQEAQLWQLTIDQIQSQTDFSALFTS